MTIDPEVAQAIQLGVAIGIWLGLTLLTAGMITVMYYQTRGVCRTLGWMCIALTSISWLSFTQFMWTDVL